MVSVVVKGSVTPKVISRSWPEGSGPFASWSSRSLCQKQRAKATPRAASETTIRSRSSPRWPTRSTLSSWAIGFRRRISAGSGVRVRGLGLGRLDLGGRVLTADRAAELADAAAQGLAELGELFRSEDDQGDEQDEEDLDWSDVGHCGLLWRGV